MDISLAICGDDTATEAEVKVIAKESARAAATAVANVAASCYASAHLPSPRVCEEPCGCYPGGVHGAGSIAKCPGAPYLTSPLPTDNIVKIPN